MRRTSCSGSGSSFTKRLSLRKRDRLLHALLINTIGNAVRVPLLGLLVQDLGLAVVPAWARLIAIGPVPVRGDGAQTYQYIIDFTWPGSPSGGVKTVAS